ncbi:MAG: hypothetical protein LBR38_00025 [Synergistaceae bacterium]|jgi:hypothetical protein|nr:hypothetical protein [Synergistaceae bacterium]
MGSKAPITREYFSRERNNDMDMDMEMVEEAFSVWERWNSFDVASVRDEAHLRRMIMERVVNAALDSCVVSVTTIEIGGRNGAGGMDGHMETALRDMPAEERDKHLAILIKDILWDVEGPGPKLRRHILRIIIEYRLMKRLEAAMQTMTGPEREQAARGLEHIEHMLHLWMVDLDEWPFRAFRREPRDDDEDEEGGSEN